MHIYLFKLAHVIPSHQHHPTGCSKNIARSRGFYSFLCKLPIETRRTDRVYTSMHSKYPSCGSFIMILAIKYRVQKIFFAFDSDNIFRTHCPSHATTDNNDQSLIKIVIASCRSQMMLTRNRVQIKKKGLVIRCLLISFIKFL